jgi:hypothetical protein
VDTIWQDVKYASRSIRRTPLFAAAVIVRLALGIVATTAVCSTMSPLDTSAEQRPVRFDGRLETERPPVIYANSVPTPVWVTLGICALGFAIRDLDWDFHQLLSRGTRHPEVERLLVPSRNLHDNHAAYGLIFTSIQGPHTCFSNDPRPPRSASRST